MKNYIQNGKTITWTNGTGSAVLSGAVVVIGGLLGIATTDIANGATGAVALEGVFECPKTAHASAQAIAQGEKISYDISAAKFANAATVQGTGDISGNCCAHVAAATTATTVMVLLAPVPGLIAS